MFILSKKYKALLVIFAIIVWQLALTQYIYGCDSLCIYTQKAESFLKEKNYSEAFRNFNKAAEFDPQNIYILNQLAEIQYVKRAHFQSNELCEKILSLDPNNQRALLLSAQILLNSNKYEESLNKLEKVISDNDSVQSILLLNKSMCYYGKKLYPKAIEHLKMIKPKYETFNVLTHMAKSFYELHNYKESSKYYIELCKRDSANYCRYSVAANSLYMAQKYDSAIQFYAASKAKGHPMNEEFYTNVAYCFFDKGDFTNAISFLNKAKEFSPYDSELMYMIAKSNMNMSKFDEARTAIDEYLNTFPDDADMVYMKAMTYYKENKTNKAEEYFKKAFAMKPELQQLRQSRIKL